MKNLLEFMFNNIKELKILKIINGEKIAIINGIFSVTPKTLKKLLI